MKIRMSIEQSDIKNWLKRLITKYHFEASDYDALYKIYERMQMHMNPYATYRLNHRMTGLPVIDDAQVAIVAMTLGSGIDSLKERYIKKEQLTEAYMLDCIANELLLDLYREFNNSYAKFHRRYIKRYVFIGNEISPTAIPSILQDIKGIKPVTEVECATELTSEQSADALREREEIVSNEYGVLTPSKSVVFYALLTDNANQACEGICMGCSNVNCENRADKYIQLSPFEVEAKKEKAPEKEALNYGYMRIFGA